MDSRKGTVIALTAAGLGLASRKAGSSSGQPPPPPMVDPHFHFLDPVNNPDQHATLLKAHPDLTAYLPEDYARDFGRLNVVKSVHMEVIPDDFVLEVEWVAGMQKSRAPWVQGIVAAADPSQQNFEQVLQKCAAASELLKGIRWILNWDGALQPGETPTVERATWPRTTQNFLDPVDPTFASNYPLLAKYGLSFDLQCNPAQLSAAASFFAQHPQIPVVLDHIGSLKLRGGNAADAADFRQWKRGMAALAALPHVCVKLSMVGYSVPGWHTDQAKEAMVRQAIRTVIKLFGSKRCMFCSNFPVPSPWSLMILYTAVAKQGREQGSTPCLFLGNPAQRTASPIRFCLCSEPLCRCCLSCPSCLSCLSSSSSSFSSTSSSSLAEQVDLDPEAGLTADFIYGKYREFVADLSAEEQHDLFYGTAATFYRL